MYIRRCLAALSSAVTLSLIACGGGGDSSAPAGPPPEAPPAPPVVAPAAPVVTLAYGIKQLQFSWGTVGGATHYRLLERPDATGSFGQVGADLTSTSVNHDIALHRRINAAYRVEACNIGGCAASDVVSLAANLVPAIGYFKASNTEAGDLFGAGLALSADGATLAVGATGEDSTANGSNGNQSNNAASGAGAVYVFTRSAGVWAQQAYLKASNTEANDRFGQAVALSADGATLAVAAFTEDSDATGVNGDQFNNLALGSGAVYVFTRAAGVWSQQAYLKASNTTANDQFGQAIALSGDGVTLAVGAPQEGSNATGINGNQLDNSAAVAGAVYVFIRSGDVWTQQAYVKASNTAAADFFGAAVALSADGATLAVGAGGEDSIATGINGNQFDNSALTSGAVYVFIRSAGVWTQQAYIKASNTGAGDFFGIAVALSADGATLAVTASGENSNATGVNGNQLDNSLAGAGAAYVFVRTAGVWTQQAYVKASNTGFEDNFGSRVALSADGATLAVAALIESSSATGINGDQSSNAATQAGAVYVFNRSTGVWSQQAYVKAANTDANDIFGQGVALSGDGAMLAVSAYAEDSSATGINGDKLDNSASYAGAVYLY